MPPILDSTGSTFNRGDFTSTNAFFWSSLDLSAYAGTDVGSTPYWIRVVDGAGKVATGYLAGVGAGETLGSELNTAWSVVTGSYDTFTTEGKEITSAIKLETTTANIACNLIVAIEGELLLFICNLTTISGQLPSVYFVDGLAWSPLQVLVAGENSKYGTSRTSGNYKFIYIENTTVCSWNSINSLKRVTDPPTTACHIVSSLNGTTRAWENIESGFDPNNIASWGIYDSSALLSPSVSPSTSPSGSPSVSHSESQSLSPSASISPSVSPSLSPSASLSPSESPSNSPSISPSNSPSVSPSLSPSGSPSMSPSESPSVSPSVSPSMSPSISPSESPSMSPSASASPSKSPSVSPSASASPSKSPSVSPSKSPSGSPSASPSVSPSASPSAVDAVDFEYGDWVRETPFRRFS